MHMLYSYFANGKKKLTDKDFKKFKTVPNKKIYLKKIKQSIKTKKKKKTIFFSWSSAKLLEN